MFKEEWKDIKGYEGIYQISSFGRVYSVKNNLSLPDEKKRKWHFSLVV